MRISDWSSDVCSSDLEADAHEFSEELDLLDDLDLGVPAFRIGGEGEQVPVTVSLALGGTWPLRFAFAQYANRRLLRHLLLQELDFDLRGVLSPQDYETISPEQAQHAFIRRATEFLATRIAAMRSLTNASHRPDSKTSFSFLRLLQQTRGKYLHTPACNLLVTTNSPPP